MLTFMLYLRTLVTTSHQEITKLRDLGRIVYRIDGIELKHANGKRVAVNFDAIELKETKRNLPMNPI